MSRRFFREVLVLAGAVLVMAAIYMGAPAVTVYASPPPALPPF